MSFGIGMAKSIVSSGRFLPEILETSAILLTNSPPITPDANEYDIN
jgi:hypothetical protein